MMRKSGPLKHPASRNVVSYVLRRWQPLLTCLQTCWRSLQNCRHSHGLMLLDPLNRQTLRTPRTSNPAKRITIPTFALCFISTER